MIMQSFPMTNLLSNFSSYPRWVSLSDSYCFVGNTGFGILENRFIEFCDTYLHHFHEINCPSLQ
jgi:hypothetical protein